MCNSLSDTFNNIVENITMLNRDIESIVNTQAYLNCGRTDTEVVKPVKVSPIRYTLTNAIINRKTDQAIEIIRNGETKMLFEPDMYGYTAIQFAVRQGNKAVINEIKLKIKREFEHKVYAS